MNPDDETNPETARLAGYLLEYWADEIGAGDPVHGESAVDVAIRLLDRLREYEASLGRLHKSLDGVCRYLDSTARV